MPRMTKQMKQENAFFIRPQTGRIGYNNLCKKCVYQCKQSFRALIVCCPFYKMTKTKDNPIVKKEKETMELFKDYPEIISVDQVIKLLQIGKVLAYKLIREKKIKAVKIGREYKIIKSSVIDLNSFGRNRIMTGSLSLRNKVWYAVLYYKNQEGQYKQKWISTGLKERGNKKVAQKLLNEYLVKFANLENPEMLKTKVSDASEEKPVLKSQDQRADMLFTEYLKWFIEQKKGELSPSVYYTYSHSLMRSLTEYFAPMKLRLKDVTTQHLLDYFDRLKKRGLKNITLKHHANILRPALRKAFKEKIIPENPYDFMPTLKKEKRTPAFYDQSDMEKFFDVIKGHHLELAFHMLAFYGLRRSELLGIRWQAIDFTNKTLSIDHKVINVQGELYLSDTMKTETSCRTLPLIPKMEQELLEQKQKIEKNMQYFGKAYNMDFFDYVFVHENGDLILPDCLTHNMLKIVRRFKLKPIRLHDLRHSCASIMIKNGVQMKQIQEWLGHSNFATTADVYSHLDYSSKLESAEKIAAVLDFGAHNEAVELIREPEVKPTVPKELQEYHVEKRKAAQADDIFEDLKQQMKTMGFTKLSELFAFLESDDEQKKEKPSKASAPEM